MRALPVPRLVYLFADLTVWLAVVLPGVAFAIGVGAVRFDLDLAVTPLVVPAMLLVALTATSMGYAIASLLPQMVANLLTQVAGRLRAHVLAAQLPRRPAAGMARRGAPGAAVPGDG